MLNKVKAFIKKFFNIMNMASFNLLINKVKMYIKKFFDIKNKINFNWFNIDKVKMFINKVKMFIKKFFDIKNKISFNWFDINKLKMYIKKFFDIMNMVRLKLLNIIASNKNKSFVENKVKMFISNLKDIMNMVRLKLLNIIDSNKSFVENKVKMFISNLKDIMNMVRLKLLNIIDSNKNKSFVAPFFGYFFDNVTWFRNIVIRFWEMYTVNKANLVAMLPQWVFVALFTNEELNDLDKKSNFANKEEDFAKAKSFYIGFFPKLVGFLAVLSFVLMSKSPSWLTCNDFLLRANYEITSGTEMIKAILTLYSNMVVILFVIGVIVTSILIDSVFFYQDTNLTTKRAFVVHNQPLEFIWTTIPAIIVTLIAIPTLMWIYLSDRDLDPTLTVSVTGHQWYWNYKIMTNKFVNSDTDCYMLPSTLDVQTVESFSDDPSYRNLKTDNYVVIPSIQKLRFMITSNDVIHSWAVPALGIKVDAVPGRATRLDVSINQEGLFYGQCSELCGVNHAFMPIGVDVVGAKHFLAHMRQS